MFETKDILIFENGNGGEISITNNDVALGEQLYQQIYLCLFGGNLEADTLGNELPTELKADWWGNSLLFSDRRAKQFNSQTERALNNTVLNSNGRVSIQRAVESDLKSFKSISDVSVDVSILNTNTVQVNVKLTQPKNQQSVILQLIWDNGKKELITEKII